MRHTTRGLSTIHFLNPGYWVWLIRLRGGVTSVGVVGTPARDRVVRSPEGFRAFLDGHRALREILADSKVIDHGSFARIAYGTKRFLGHGRWALVGEGATATDPLYSPGLDFVALECDFITDIVAREADGEPADALAKRIDLYDRFLDFRHEAVMRLYRGLYGMIGSYELMRLKWDFDIASYHNLWVAPFMTDLHLDEGWLRRQLRLRNLVLRAMENFAACSAAWRRRCASRATTTAATAACSRTGSRTSTSCRRSACRARRRRRSSRPSARSTSCAAMRSRCSARMRAATGRSARS